MNIEPPFYRKAARYPHGFPLHNQILMQYFRHPHDPGLGEMADTRKPGSPRGRHFNAIVSVINYPWDGVISSTNYAITGNRAVFSGLSSVGGSPNAERLTRCPWEAFRKRGKGLRLSDCRNLVRSCTLGGYAKLLFLRLGEI
jgi:hypothetical protein